MFGLKPKRKQKPVDLDAALATMMKSAAETAEAIIALAPDDRPVGTDELQLSVLPTTAG